MENNISTEERAAAGEASSKIGIIQMANGAEALEDLIECKSAETEKGDAASPIFPPEVVIEILCWLSLRSLARLQLVCKEWRGFIRGRYLMKRNLDRRKAVCHWHNVSLWDDPAKHEPINESIAYPINESIVFVDGCDGLLLMRSFPIMKFSIWNLATFSVLKLPDPHKDVFGMAFCYAQSTGNYVVVCIYMDESGREGCEVLIPGQSESWRPLAFPDIAEVKGLIEKQCLLVLVVSAGEAVHTVLILKVGSDIIQKVVSLDLETECFTVTSFPEVVFNNWETMWGLDWNGKLALTELVGNNLHVTELEDFKKQRWCRKKKIILVSFLKELDIDEAHLVPLFFKDGDIWFCFEETLLIVHKIETGCFTRLGSWELQRAEKLYPYKQTLLSFPGMQPETRLRKCLPFFDKVRLIV